MNADQNRTLYSIYHHLKIMKMGTNNYYFLVSNPHKRVFKLTVKGEKSGTLCDLVLDRNNVESRTRSQ